MGWYIDEDEFDNVLGSVEPLPLGELENLNSSVENSSNGSVHDIHIVSKHSVQKR